MIKIIEEGQKTFIRTCDRCGCKFQYDLSDLSGLDYLCCPYCHTTLTHIGPQAKKVGPNDTDLSKINKIDWIDTGKINVDDILVISDDLDLDIGNFRLRPSGSSGGHNGLKNIELHLNTNKYKRLKVGISNRKDIDTKDYVLGKINSDDKKILDNLNKTFVNILNDFFTKDFTTLMSMYNRKNR